MARPTAIPNNNKGGSMSRLSHDICDILHVPHHRNLKKGGNRREKDGFKKTERRVPKKDESLVTSVTTTVEKRIILAGGGGYLGRLLKDHFHRRGWEVVILTRSKACAEDSLVHWDGETLGPWADELNGAHTLINLAGRSVNCRYHARNRREMMDSRINTTRVLGEAVARCGTPPKVWLNSSTATIYKHTFGPAWNEDGEIGWTTEAKDQFSVEIATEWERAFDECLAPKTRKIKLRTAMVMSRAPDANNAFIALRRLAKLGLGGRMGGGRQFVSWIHGLDFIRAIEFLIEHQTIDGIVNIATPGPLPNAEMMRLFRARCGLPVGLPAAKWILELGAFFLRTETELIIKSRRVVPGRLLEAGFQFEFEDFESAIEDLMNAVTLT
jgi:uncharacterized protein (TIGR01777 family)